MHLISGTALTHTDSAGWGVGAVDSHGTVRSFVSCFDSWSCWGQASEMFINFVYTIYSTILYTHNVYTYIYILTSGVVLVIYDIYIYIQYEIYIWYIYRYVWYIYISLYIYDIYIADSRLCDPGWNNKIMGHLGKMIWNTWVNDGVNIHRKSWLVNCSTYVFCRIF